MASLWSIRNDGVYMIRFSVLSVSAVKEDSFVATITDGTAECSILIDQTIFEYIRNVSSMKEIVIMIGYCRVIPRFRSLEIVDHVLNFLFHSKMERKVR